MAKVELEVVKADLLPAASEPCSVCPWRTANQGRRHRFGWYAMRNLKRLWNEIRNGGGCQTCHPTDPSHPEHVACGAREGSTPRECAGSVIVVLQEMRKMCQPDGTIDNDDYARYAKARGRKGLSKTGVLYWVFQRYAFGGVPFMGGRKLPKVDENCPGVALPECLR